MTTSKTLLKSIPVVVLLTLAVAASDTLPRLLKRIAEETGTTIGGKLYPGALSGPDGPVPTYIDMMRHNARTLAQALLW